MDLYKAYPAHIVFMRRTFAVVAGVLALPVMLFWKDRARFYSYLHRVWAKTSEKPVWMDQAEKADLRFLLIRRRHTAIKKTAYSNVAVFFIPQDPRSVGPFLGSRQSVCPPTYHRW